MFYKHSIWEGYQLRARLVLRPSRPAETETATATAPATSPSSRRHSRVEVRPVRSGGARESIRQRCEAVSDTWGASWWETHNDVWRRGNFQTGERFGKAGRGAYRAYLNAPVPTSLRPISLGWSAAEADPSCSIGSVFIKNRIGNVHDS